HPEQCRPDGGHQIPVALQGGRGLSDEQVADESSAHADHHADDRHAEPVEAALTLESGREHRPLDSAEADTEQIGPQRDDEERFGHPSTVVCAGDNRSVPTYRDEAVILRTHKLGEADRIVTMLSRRHGKIRAVAKGVRRTSSKFGSRLEPFMVADVQLYEGRSLDIVQQAESLGAYGADIAVDYERFTAASAMVETADRLNEAEATTEQYLLLVGGLRSLSRGEHAARSILDSYLLRVMALSGWAPALEDCARCGTAGPHHHFGPQLGGTVCASCAPAGSPRISASA